MNPYIKCPAGAEEHPVLSPNRLDVQCRIEGGLRPATMPPSPTGERERVVCCADYTKCAIWRFHKELESGPSTKAQRDAAMSDMKPHTLSGVTRDSVRV